MRGLRPIVEIQYVDYIFYALATLLMIWLTYVIAQKAGKLPC
jgi:pyruvate/2-oxoglutarate/acetoin dehydrogenase E1 component